MTTENLDQPALDAAVAAAKAVAADVVQRRATVAQEVLDIQNQRQIEGAAFVTAAGANDRRHLDSLATRGEELAQLDTIPGVAPAAPSAPAAPAEPVAPASAGGTAVQPVVAPAPVAPAPAPAVNRADPRGWDGWSFVLAILIALFGVVVASEYDDNWYRVFHGPLDTFGASMMVGLWWILVVAFFFFLGGTIGTFLPRRRPVAQQPPAQPAA